MMLRKLSALAALLLLALGTACTPVEEAVLEEPEVEPSIGDESALNALVGGFIDAVNRGDADAVAELYAADGVRMPPDGPPVVGRESIRQDLAQSFEANAVELQTQVDETRFSGELAYVRGTFAMTVTARDGSASSEVEGNWVRLMRREPDGFWLIARELWNIRS